MADSPQGRFQRQAAYDEDDWFAASPLEPEDVADISEEAAWQDEPEVEQPPGPPDSLGRRQLLIVAAVVAVILLGAAGVLLARSLTGSDTPAPTVSTPVVTTPVSTGTTSTTSTDTLPTTTGSTTTTPSTTTPTSGAVPTGTTLRPGDTGASVTALQQALSSAGFVPGTADGNYGPATTKAVAAFQTANGLQADGIAGAKTIAALNAAVASG